MQEERPGWLHSLNCTQQRSTGIVSARFDLCSEQGIWIVGVSDTSGVLSILRLLLDDPEPIHVRSCIFSPHEDPLSAREALQKPWDAFEFIHHTTEEVAWCEEGRCKILQCSIPVVEAEAIHKSYSHESAILSFAVNTNGSLMTSVSRDGWVKLWDIYSGTLIDSTSNLSMAMLVDLSFVGPNKVAAALSSGEVYVWDVFGFHLELQSIVSFTHESICTFCSRLVLKGSQNVCFIGAGSKNGTVYVSEKSLHGVSEWSEIQTFRPNQDCTGHVSGICISPCGAYMGVALEESLDKHKLVLYNCKEHDPLSCYALAATPMLMDFFTVEDDCCEGRAEEKLHIGIVYASGMPRMTWFKVVSPESADLETAESARSSCEDIQESLPRPVAHIFPQKQIQNKSVAVGPSHVPSSITDGPSSPNASSFTVHYDKSGSWTDSEPLISCMPDQEAKQAMTANSTQSSCCDLLEAAPSIQSRCSNRQSPVLDRTNEQLKSSSPKECNLNTGNEKSGTAAQDNDAKKLVSWAEECSRQATFEDQEWRPVQLLTSCLTEHQLNTLTAAECQPPEQSEPASNAVPRLVQTALAKSANVHKHTCVFADLPPTTETVAPVQPKSTPMQLNPKWLRLRSLQSCNEDLSHPNPPSPPSDSDDEALQISFDLASFTDALCSLSHPIA